MKSEDTGKVLNKTLKNETTTKNKDYNVICMYITLNFYTVSRSDATQAGMQQYHQTDHRLGFYYTTVR